MGRSKHKQLRGERRCREKEEELSSSAYDAQPDTSLENAEDNIWQSCEELALEDNGLKHTLYQRAVQSPKGEISYCQKFFLNYIGGRTPLHFREDFCGTALICAEWVRSDSRRTAVGLDLDADALTWGLSHNIAKINTDALSRIHLFKGNVLNPLSAANSFNAADSTQMPESADIVCALNFSCCCLQSRKELVLYFKRALCCISNKGGVFVMDLYGGISSERALKIRRRFDDFTYIWEQEEFDIVTRTTRISLHFQIHSTRKVIRHAFTYKWRLWTIPEIKECMEEGGFDSTHCWLSEKSDLIKSDDNDDEENVLDFEEVSNLKQCEAWNAYVVGVRI